MSPINPNIKNISVHCITLFKRDNEITQRKYKYNIYKIIKDRVSDTSPG